MITSIKNDNENSEALKKISELQNANVSLDDDSEESYELETLLFLTKKYKENPTKNIVSINYSSEQKENFKNDYNKIKENGFKETLSSELKAFLYNTDEGRDCIFNSFVDDNLDEDITLDEYVENYLKNMVITNQTVKIFDQIENYIVKIYPSIKNKISEMIDITKDLLTPKLNVAFAMSGARNLGIDSKNNKMITEYTINIDDASILMKLEIEIGNNISEITSNFYPIIDGKTISEKLDGLECIINGVKSNYFKYTIEEFNKGISLNIAIDGTVKLTDDFKEDYPNDSDKFENKTFENYQMPLISIEKSN